MSHSTVTCLTLEMGYCSWVFRLCVPLWEPCLDFQLRNSVVVAMTVLYIASMVRGSFLVPVPLAETSVTVPFWPDLSAGPVVNIVFPLSLCISYFPLPCLSCSISLLSEWDLSHGWTPAELSQHSLQRCVALPGFVVWPQQWLVVHLPDIVSLVYVFLIQCLFVELCQ